LFAPSDSNSTPAIRSSPKCVSVASSDEPIAVADPSALRAIASGLASSTVRSNVNSRTATFSASSFKSGSASVRSSLSASHRERPRHMSWSVML
jgi:hypothetical protein